MGKFTGKHQNWNEFQWEEEIRRDERRISGYFRELAACLDLPDEEELIFGQLSSQMDLVPSSEAAESLHNWFTDNDENEDEPLEISNPARTADTAVIEELDMLSSEWNILTATPMPESLTAQVLGCSCAFAKLLARTSDFLTPGENCTTALQISLGKRSLSDLKDTVNALVAIASRHPFFREQTPFFITRLAELRERLIEKLTSLTSRL
ncbi:MAG: hypothetical protein IKC89_03810 [Lentisphaeria bacterium]|nr:hypothetical protein [Lentisphaeria bacterium]